MRTPRIYVIYGNVGSGKTTLATALAAHWGIYHLSSDAIRIELTGSPNGKTKQVFKVMNERASRFLSFMAPFIMDSTGMSKEFRALVKEVEGIIPMCIIELKCAPHAWRARETIRDDRWNIGLDGVKETFVMPYRAYEDSSQVDLEPELKINTTDLTPEEVFNRVVEYINLDEVRREEESATIRLKSETSR